MTDEKKAAIRARLQEARDDILYWARELNANEWTRPVYSHGDEWTAQDVLRHLTWAEGGMLRLIQQIRQGHEGVAKDFDLDRYNALGVRKLKDKTPSELMAMMNENREGILQILDELDEDELAMAGRHGSLHILTIEQILNQIANHERMHLQDLQQAFSH